MAATSRIDFTPAQTTTIPVRASVVEVGRLVPAVARVAVHAAEAAGGEDADARARREVGGGGDRRAAVRRRGRPPARGRARRTSRRRRARRSSLSASSSSPTRTSPRDHARSSPARLPPPGPPPRPACATSRLRGRGRPWLMIVLSSATTGRPSASASATSGAILMPHRLRRPSRPGPRSPRRAPRRGSPGCSRCRASAGTSLIAVSRTWISMPSRRCSTSTTFPPRSATTRSSPASAPGPVRHDRGQHHAPPGRGLAEPDRLGEQRHVHVPARQHGAHRPPSGAAPRGRASARPRPPRPRPRPRASSAPGAAPSPAPPRRPMTVTTSCT